MVDDQATPLDSVFHALASGTRRSILQELAASDRTVGELAEPYSISLAAVAKHIDVLERAGLVAKQRQGRNTLCHLNPNALAEATRMLDYYRSFWSDQLDSLQSYLLHREQSV
jgi:DNA-binding transcriptional ArsR family regulator